MKKSATIILLLALSLSVGCAKNSTDSAPNNRETAQTAPIADQEQTQSDPTTALEDVKIEEPANDETAEIPQVSTPALQPPKFAVSEFINKDMMDIISNFGNMQKEKKGEGFTIDAIPDVTVYRQDGSNLIIQAVVNNSAVSIYGARIGQSPSETIKTLGKPDYAGPDEENGGYVLQFTISSDETVSFYSDDEKSPTLGAVIYYAQGAFNATPIEFSDAQVDLDAYLATDNGEGAAFVMLTNLGSTPVVNAAVEVTTVSTGGLGNDQTNSITANFDRIEVGETLRFRIEGVSTGNKFSGEIGSVYGQAVEPRK